MSQSNQKIKIKEILTRGVENIYPSKRDFTKRLLSGRPISLYAGIDPTGRSLHLGHGSILLKLKEFVNLGHQVTVLIGDFTATIGDPTDKKITRRRLSVQEVIANYKNYKKQIGRIIDLKKIKIVYNSRWFSKMTAAQILELAGNFTTSQLLERDMFQERIKTGRPIYLNELLYPILQGYDSVALDVQAEVGGNDQTFNMLIGRTLMKRRGKEKYVLSLKLLTDSHGKKMGKTEGNMLALDDSPEDMYGKIMSWPDDLMALGFELATDLQNSVIKENLNKTPKEAKMALAKAIVSVYYSAALARRAENDFVAKFQNKNLPVNLPKLKILPGARLADILVNHKIIVSKSEFKRLITAGGISFQGEKITDLWYQVKSSGTLKVGKKKFFRIVVD